MQGDKKEDLDTEFIFVFTATHLLYSKYYIWKMSLFGTLHCLKIILDRLRKSNRYVITVFSNMDF